MSDEGNECHDCGTTHTDWEQTGRHAVDSGSHQGIVEHWECGRCGATAEVRRR